jgi:virginiamycin B lyase
MGNGNGRSGGLLGGRYKVALAPALVFVALLMACASEALALAPGSVEEYPVTTGYRLSLQGIAVGPEDGIWYLQSGRGEAQFGRMTTGEQPLGGTYLGGSYVASDIAEGADGNMWIPLSTVSGEEPAAIARVTPAEEVELFPINGPTIPGCEGCGAGAIARGADGQMWFTDDRPDSQGHIFIGSIDTSGHITPHPIPTGVGHDLPTETAPVALALGSDGAVWFTDRGHDAEGHNLVGRITPGAIVEYPIPAIGAAPAGIALGADGDMWFAEPGVGRIGRVTPTGAFTEFSAPNISEYLHGVVRGPDGKIWFGVGSSFEGNAALGSISTTGEVRSYAPTFVTGPGNLTVGPEGDIWFTDQHFAMEGFTYVGRFAVPFAPVLIAPPSIAGTATAGKVLSASSGEWQHEPQTISYQWLRCDSAGGGCVDVPGAQTSTYGLGTADVGHTLRVQVLAGNLGGEGTATSASTVGVAPAPPPLEPPLIRLRVVGVTATWRFVHSHGRSIARSLEINGLSAGMSVRTICTGAGCRFAYGRAAGSHAPRCGGDHCSYTRAAGRDAALGLATLLKPARLRPGAHITIVVIAPGMLGKAFELTVKRQGQPALTVTCRAIGSYSTVHEC